MVKKEVDCVGGYTMSRRTGWSQPQWRH